MKLFTSTIFHLAFAFAVVMTANPAAAIPTWATLNTEANPLDLNPSDARALNYSGYFCTIDTANSLFGGSSVEKIQEYITYHYSTTAAGTKAFSDPYFTDESYTLDRYDGTVYNSADYVAVAFYGDHQFRVYGEGSAQLVDGSLVFDDMSATAGTVGEWTQASYVIPEPSSGLLLLFGWAALGLRRRRRS